MLGTPASSSRLAGLPGDAARLGAGRGEMDRGDRPGDDLCEPGGRADGERADVIRACLDPDARRNTNHKALATTWSGAVARSPRDAPGHPPVPPDTRMTPCRSVPVPGAEGAPAPRAEGTGTGRERPATRDSGHPPASELPQPAETPNPSRQKPRPGPKDSNPAATRTPAPALARRPRELATRYGILRSLDQKLTR